MKSILILLGTICFILFFSSCKKYDSLGREIKEYEKIKNAGWLLGKWERKDSLGTLSENWRVENDSILIGNSYFVNEKDTIHAENIELTESKEIMVYEVTIKGENNDEPVRFQLTESTDSILFFENPKHNYPSNIKYVLNKDKSVKITVSGKQKGVISAINYSLIRVK